METGPERVMKKPVVIYCNNYLGFTLLSSGGVLEDMAAQYDVTILTVPATEKSVRAVVGDECRVVAIESRGGGFVYGLISDILAMTYATKDGRRNLTGALHRKAHLKLVQGRSFAERMKKRFIVCASELAEKCRVTRKTLNVLFGMLSPKGEFLPALRDVKPVLCVATTAGLGKDGVFFAAANALNIPTLALIQSWDRTASKGYPAHHPDYCIVWNEPMAKEADMFLEIPRERVFVEGAPPWDEYLNEHGPLAAAEKEAFFRKWNLDLDKKLVFVALNGPATHGENARLIRDLCKANLQNMQVMFRSHPAYLIEPEKTQELVKVFAEFGVQNMHLMHPIVRDPSNKDYVVTEEDRKFMHDMFRACDVTVSIMSTWMIESSIFDKPNICIEYGRYITQLYDFDLSEYKAEHITRIFDYEAVHRVRSPEEMIATLQNIFKNPRELRANRVRLADLETGPHKGHARAAFAARISKIIETL